MLTKRKSQRDFLYYEEDMDINISKLKENIPKTNPKIFGDLNIKIKCTDDAVYFIFNKDDILRSSDWTSCTSKYLSIKIMDIGVGWRVDDKIDTSNGIRYYGSICLQGAASAVYSAITSGDVLSLITLFLNIWA